MATGSTHTPFDDQDADVRYGAGGYGAAGGTDRNTKPLSDDDGGASQTQAQPSVAPGAAASSPAAGSPAPNGLRAMLQSCSPSRAGTRRLPQTTQLGIAGVAGACVVVALMTAAGRFVSLVPQSMPYGSIAAGEVKRPSPEAMEIMEDPGGAEDERARIVAGETGPNLEGLSGITSIGYWNRLSERDMAKLLPEDRERMQQRRSDDRLAAERYLLEDKKRSIERQIEDKEVGRRRREEDARIDEERRAEAKRQEEQRLEEDRRVNEERAQQQGREAGTQDGDKLVSVP